MSCQNQRGGVLRHCLVEARNPIFAMGCIPFMLDYSFTRGILPLPLALPVVGSRVAKAGKYQRRDWVIHVSG
jgi:hypothetical protein